MKARRAYFTSPPARDVRTFNDPAPSVAPDIGHAMLLEVAVLLGVARPGARKLCQMARRPSGRSASLRRLVSAMAAATANRKS